MILYFNVRVTDTRLSQYVYERSAWVRRDNRLDIFKYTLSSYAAFSSLLTKVIINIQLDPEYHSRQTELESFIYNLFPGCTLRWERNFYAKDWLASYYTDLADHEDQVIWLCGNEDHPFIDYDLSILESGIKILEEDEDPFSFAIYSHWPECMNIQTHFGAELTPDQNWVRSQWCETSAIQLIKKEKFLDYFTFKDWGDSSLFRTDCLMELGYKRPTNFYTPTREISRHYDGYSHVSCSLDRGLPLVIPDGFFENELKIRYGYNDRLPGWTNINPTLPDYQVDPSGSDYTTTIDKLPLFWKPVEVDINPDFSIENANSAFKAATLRRAHAPMKTWGVLFDDDPNRVSVKWASKHF